MGPIDASIQSLVAEIELSIILNDYTFYYHHLSRLRGNDIRDKATKITYYLRDHRQMIYDETERLMDMMRSKDKENHVVALTIMLNKLKENG